MDVLACALADYEHLAEVTLGHGVALEAVLVAALLLANLRVMGSVTPLLDRS